MAREPLLPRLLLAVALAWFIVRAVTTLDLFAFDDEANQIVNGIVVAKGGRLYDTIFSNHGPLTDVAAWMTYLLTGSYQIEPYRVSLIPLYLLAASSVYLASTGLSRALRSLAAAGFLVLVGSLGPIWWGHMLLYQNFAGAFALVFVALCVLPSLLHEPVGRVAGLVGGASYALTFFSAYSFSIAQLLFVVAAILADLAQRRARLVPLRRFPLRPFLLGAAVATSGQILWLLFHGSVRGFVAQHLYYNTFIIAPQYHYDPLLALHQLATMLARPAWALNTAWKTNTCLIVFAAAATLLIGQSMMARRGWGRRGLGYEAGAILAFFLAIVYLNPRAGQSWHLSTLGIVVCGILPLAVARSVSSAASATTRLGTYGIAAACAALAGWLYFTGTEHLGHGITYADVKAHRGLGWMEQHMPASLVRDLTAADDPVLFYPFNPLGYLVAKRRPASSAMYYLPQMAQFHGSVGAVHPCKDVQDNKPKVVVIDLGPIIDDFIERYDPCLTDYVKTHYTLVESSRPAVFVRSDWAPRVAHLVQRRGMRFVADGREGQRNEAVPDRGAETVPALAGR